MDANLDLKFQINKKEIITNKEQEIEKDASSEKLKIALRKIDEIEKEKMDLEVSEKNLQTRLIKLKAENNEWASKTQQIYI